MAVLQRQNPIPAKEKQNPNEDCIKQKFKTLDQKVETLRQLINLQIVAPEMPDLAITAIIFQRNRNLNFAVSRKKISHVKQEIKLLMINPGPKSAGLCKEKPVGVGWFSLELPQTPTNILHPKISCTSQATINKESNSAARSQEIMEIPTIISETLTTLKP